MTAPGLPASTGGLSQRRQLLAAGTLVVGLPVLTATLVEHRDRLNYATPILLVLSLVVTVALVGGLRVALPAALFGGLDLNWFFTPPLGTLVIRQPQQLLVLVVYAAFAVAVSVIVDLAARRTAEANRARAEARALSNLAGATLTEARTLPDLLEQVRTTFGMRQVSLVEIVGGTRSVVDSVGSTWADVDDRAADVPAGPCALLHIEGPELVAEDRRVLASFAEAAGRALEGRRLAEQVQDNARLEAAERMRTALLAAVGHDLRTPLAGIKAAVSSLRQSDITFTEDEQHELLAGIETATDRLQGLVANLLDASRLQAGALAVHLQQVSIEEAADAVLVAMPPGSGERITLDFDPMLPDVRADPGLLERVLANLLDNALRHTPSGTMVTLRAGTHNGGVICEVVDHGAGIAPSQLSQLYAPFQRSGDRTPGGIGLGLTVARGFTEAMGGTLQARETRGGGLTMRVSLPVAGGGMREVPR